MTVRRSRKGYILLETMVAMAVLSIGMIAINRSMHQALLTRAIARDYTQARFLLDKVLGEMQLQFQLVEGEEQGDFGKEFPRFAWSKEVAKVALPFTDLPSDFPAVFRDMVEQRPVYLGRITVTVSWTRAGQPYERRVVTLVAPEKLWLPRNENPSLPPGEGGPTHG